MANACRWTPVVFKKEGNKTVEKDSKLYEEISKVVKDRNDAWKIWAYTKTKTFRESHPDAEHDELGEVKFSSFVDVMGLQEAYDQVKDSQHIAKDYGVDGKVFQHPEEAMQIINDINSKEDRFVAIARKADNQDGTIVEVLPKGGPTIEMAREQSFNNALSKEILKLMNSLGFDIGFSSDPRYKGIFDPANATMYNGLVKVIDIAKGEEGEEALPEEFAHFIIEGLIHHPLVQRLLETLDEGQMMDILGDSYDQYFESYGGDMYRIKKEAAGKLLAEFIQKKGTINPETVESKKNLLSRIWEWAKKLFQKATERQVAALQERAHNNISEIYDLIAAKDGMPLFDKGSVLSGKELYLLRQEVNTAEKMSYKGMELAGRMIHSMRRDGKKVTKEEKERFEKIRDSHDADQYARSLEGFIIDAKEHLLAVEEGRQRWADLVDRAYVVKNPKIKDLKAVAGYVRSVSLLEDGYKDMLSILATMDQPENYQIFVKGDGNLEGAKVTGENLAKGARSALDILNKLVVNKQETERRVLYMYSRTVYKEDKVREAGKNKDDVMAMQVILEHADKDINFIERWISALSDASDSLLPIIDSLVKNQQYERDMEMIEWKKRIALADQKLRKAGFTSDIMYERNEEGTPNGRIMSPYDFDAWKELSKKKRKEFNEANPGNEEAAKKQYRDWRNTKVKNPKTGKGEYMLLRKFYDPAMQELYDKEQYSKIPPDALYDEVPNPNIFTGKVAEFERQFPKGSPQREYYDTVMDIKLQMMKKIPRRGQQLYKAVYVSKDLVEGIMDNTTGNPVRATFDYYARYFTRRPDDIGFGNTEEYKNDILQIMRDEEDPKKAADKILEHLADAVDSDIYADIDPKKVEKILKDKSLDEAGKIKKIIGTIAAGTFYEVDTDFANHRIQRLPIYFTRPLRRDKKRGMPMLSTDFTGTLTAYSAMAVNYEKMNEIVDILEVARDYTNERKILVNKSGDQSPYSMFQAFGKVFQGFVTKAGNGSNTAGRLEDYLNSVVYEQHKDDEGTFEIIGVNLDTAKTLDFVKDYTGLLTLGLNIFSTVSNLTVGKLQQWIEAVGGEDFNVKEYALAVKQYGEHIVPCMLEMAEPIKHDKMSLLIEMFDPLKDYYESLRETHNGNSIVSRILGNGALGYIGMGAGEHILRVQTMLACLNHIKLVDINNSKGEKISLYDALEVVTDEEGISRLELKPNLAYERDLVDTSGNTFFDAEGKFIITNKNYGKPLRDENGKIKTELVQISCPKETDEGTKKQITENYNTFIQKRRKRMGKVNDSLNGAFNVVDKGAAHRKALLRLALQFRQWMPAHYSRRFAKAHYDGDMEQWREGYYRTVGRFINQMQKDLRKAQFEYAKLKDSMSEHEKANFRRAEAEITMFMALFSLVRVGGRVKDRDRSWLDRMVLYQIHRMYLEVGASMPLNTGFFANIIQLLNSPMAAMSTFDKVKKVLNILNAADEIETGRYQGWSEWERDAFQLVPFLPQVWKGYDFDDSMFSQFERDD